MDQVRRQWPAAHVGADKINTWDKVSGHLVRKNSLPYDRNKPHQPHNFMHNKLVIADDVVVTGSFNLSNHAMGNAENVLLIRTPALRRHTKPTSNSLWRDTEDKYPAKPDDPARRVPTRVADPRPRRS